MRSAFQNFGRMGAASARGLASIISSMFANNEQGAWYDPTDFNANWRRNRLTYTEQFDNAIWTTASASISANAVTAPDGTLTADKLIEAAASAEHYVVRNLSAALEANTIVTSSVYVKAAERSKVGLQYATTGDAAVAWDLTTGSQLGASVGSSFISASITSVGDGWYRCVMTYNRPSLTSVVPRIVVLSDSATSIATRTYLGDGTSGIYIWGAQLEVGSTATTYQRITDGVADYADSNTPVLYQDYSGTTPVTAVEQPVGLMLDKRKGLVLGSDVVVNGDFSTDTVWTKGAGWTITGGAAVGSSAASINQPNVLTIGKWYLATVVVTAYTSGPLYVGTLSNLKTLPTGTGTKTAIFLADATTLYMAGLGAFTGSVDSIVVRELQGNHAYQSTSAARPTLRARYNVITYSEDVTNVVWVKNATATTPTATTVSFPAANDYIHQTLTAATYAAKSVTISVELSGSGTTAFGFYDNVSGFQVDAVTLTATPTRYTATKTIGTGAVDVRLIPAGRLSGGTATSVTVTKIDVRMSNLIGTGIPLYQRIAAATDYDTVGFPVYIQGNGSSQFMQTAAIDFSGTDKMTVWSAVRKLSDAAQGMVCELTASYAANAASMFLSAPGGAAANYTSGSRGAAVAAADQVSTATTYTAPISGVLSSSHDIAGDLTTLRVNTVAATSATGDKGAGNFANAALYLLSRGGASLWFGGYFFGAIIRGAASNESQIMSGERYLNLRSKAY